MKMFLERGEPWDPVPVPAISSAPKREQSSTKESFLEEGCEPWSLYFLTVTLGKLFYLSSH